MYSFGDFIKLLKIKKWPTRSQWGQFFKVLTKKEKVIFFTLFILGVVSFIYIFVSFYFKNTKPVPARGGSYTEGVIGQPRFINPIYANSDVDRDLVQLVFSGLMKYDDNLNIIPDLAQRYEIEEDGKVYKFYLKDKIFWQDKTPLTADDVVFTIKTIQNSEYKSPLQANWVGVEVEKIGDSGVKFTIRKPYGSFLENCTVKILPKHIWADIPPENSSLSVYNLKPVASGPYKIKEIQQDKPDHIESLILSPNPSYFGKKPNIGEIKFVFFDDKEKLIKEAKNNKIKGLSSDYFIEGLGSGWNYYKLDLSRYFALFLNPANSKILSVKDIRIALNYGTNKKEIVEKVFGKDANSIIIAQSPILPDIYGFNSPSKIYDFDPEKAKDILEKAGFKDENQDGIREKITKKDSTLQLKSELKSGSQGKEVEELQKCLAKFPEIYPEGEITGSFRAKTEAAVKRFQEKYAAEILQPSGLKEGTGTVGKATRNKLNEVCFPSGEDITPLIISLVTVEQPELVSVANVLQKQWEPLGIKLEIKTFSSSQLEQDYIKPRNYEILLFGEVLGAIPDPFPFWHSNQKNDPGLNLSMYDNKDADKLLEDARQSLDFGVRAEKLNSFQNLLIADAPAVFLYSPDYVYLVSKEIKGITSAKIVDPSKRFIGVENWYIKTKRIWD